MLVERYEAVYTRQSFEKENSVSIEAQIDDCNRLYSKTGTIKIYQDEGYSDGNTDRPDVQRLIKDTKQGDISKVVVYKFD